MKEGTAAKSMIPVFPTKTFPNHYTIATGMRPANHGLVDNTFYDPDRKQVYRINDRSKVQDGSWYGGLPLWSLAEKHGMKAASYFFVGSEADISGIRPSYFYEYDGNVKNLDRINQVLDWLALPEHARPRLITLYFSVMDDAGHRYGPDNDGKLQEAILNLDSDLGVLFEETKKLDLDINIILVSDHGMSNVKREGLINVEEIMKGVPGKYFNNGALAHVYLDRPSRRNKVIRKLRRKKGDFSVVDPFTDQFYGERTDYSGRIGEILIIPDLGFYLVTKSGFVNYQKKGAIFDTDTFGEHGYHPDNKVMNAIFYANGPAIKNQMEIEEFENIHVYPLVCMLLGLPIPDNIDGDPIVLEEILEN